MEAFALFLTLLFFRYGRQLLAIAFIVFMVLFVRDHPWIALTIGLLLGALAAAAICVKAAPPKR